MGMCGVVVLCLCMGVGARPLWLLQMAGGGRLAVADRAWERPGGHSAAQRPAAGTQASDRRLAPDCRHRASNRPRCPFFPSAGQGGAPRWRWCLLHGRALPGAARSRAAGIGGAAHPVVRQSGIPAQRAGRAQAGRVGAHARAHDRRVCASGRGAGAVLGRGKACLLCRGELGWWAGRQGRAGWPGPPTSVLHTRAHTCPAPPCAAAQATCGC